MLSGAFWYISSPVAGDAMAIFCAFVIRGINSPLAVLFTSSKALASALLPSVLMAKLCAAALLNKKNVNAKREIIVALILKTFDQLIFKCVLQHYFLIVKYAMFAAVKKSPNPVRATGAG
jgi:hypothetical protein